jgi:hypothetical protein
MMPEPTKQVELVFVTLIMKPNKNAHMLQERSTTKPMGMDMF